MTDPVSATGASSGLMTGQQPWSSTDRTDQFSKDTFLKLLVAQLKYQDPLNPSNGTEFIAQTAQLSMVDKLNSLATQNAELVASQQMMGATSLIGRTVTFTGADSLTATGTVTGAAFDASGPVLVVRTQAGTSASVSLSSVTAVTSPAATSPAPTSPAPSDPAPSDPNA